jgi:hypothetical protein
MPVYKYFGASRTGPIHPARMDAVLNSIRWVKKPAMDAVMKLIQDQAAYIMALETELSQSYEERKKDVDPGEEPTPTNCTII